jgi:hypothetical protein
MVWIFAAVVLVLAVFNDGFRKLALWSAGIAAALVVIMFIAHGTT